MARTLAMTPKQVAEPTNFTPIMLADRWQVSKATIFRMIKRGTLPTLDYSMVRIGIDTVREIEAGTTPRAVGRIYFVGAAGVVKIGYTIDPIYRLRNLRAGSPIPLEQLAIMPGTPADEKALHVRFAAYRSHGEWFRHEGELADYIGSLT